MLSNDFDLSKYMSNGIENVVKGVVKASLKNQKETVFILKFALSSKKAKKKRESFAKNGEKFPAFLIGSITSSCNLFCKGCYSRQNKSCGDDIQKQQLSSERWESIFKEASDLGVSFILLAGGEPLMRKDVIEKAAKVKDIIFPIFTNAILLRDEYLKLFDKNRNLVPMLSIEGSRQQTEDRRGQGTYNVLMNVMDKLKKKGILYGVSITITTENLLTVLSLDFVSTLYDKGCRAFVFVEYVPVVKETRNLAPTNHERAVLELGQQKLREQYPDAIFLSFPGDEKYAGGCLAAGRGFFHINVDGAAEPCPFSPYSDTNLNDCTLREALKSPLFTKLNETGMLLGEHDGGCLLFEKENEVKKLIM